jgi:hypothetical protein
VVVVPGARIPGDGNFFHSIEARYALTWAYTTI